MLTKFQGIIFAFILGVVCPGVIIGMLQKRVPPVSVEFSICDSETYKNENVLDKISVLLQDGSVMIMEMNDYLTCVVLQEMPANFELEALKAQAVVARTYTLRRKEYGGKHIDTAVCTESDCCQGFCLWDTYLDHGGKEEMAEKVKQAVEMTEDLVLVYNGELIDATYFSCSGGRTEDAKAVWGTEIPYLKATDSPGEEYANYYVDTTTFTAAEFMDKLDLELSVEPQIGNILYTSGGGVDCITVNGTVFKGTEIRKKLGLRSTAFAIKIVANTVIITTKGFGHRVGMSQYGADAMALEGNTFPEILAHYYQGTQLIHYNGN